MAPSATLAGPPTSAPEGKARHDHLEQQPKAITVRRPADLTNEWPSDIFGAKVDNFTTKRIGTRQIGECFRIDLRHAQPPPPSTTALRGKNASSPSAVLKIAAEDEKSRQTGVALGFYEREVRFYAEIALELGEQALAPCFHASFDEEGGTYSIILGDAGPAIPGDEIAGATMEQALLAMTELGHFQAGQRTCYDTLEKMEWLYRKSVTTQSFLESIWPSYVERYGKRMSPEHRHVCETFIACFDAYTEG